MIAPDRRRRVYMIELLIGPYRSGKTGRLLKKLVEYKREHPLDACLILVPSHRYGRLVRDQLMQLVAQDVPAGGTPGLFGVEISTIYEVCGDVVRRSGSLANVLPRELCISAVGHALVRLNEKGDLVHLAQMSRFPGASGAVFKLIDELERAALAPSQVVAAVDATAGSGSRHLELAKVYREYWSVLEENACTDQKRLAYTAREVLSSHQSENFRLAMLIVDGFDRISPLQAEVMLGLSKRAGATHIAFDYLLPEDRPAAEEDDDYAWKDSSYKELITRFSVEPYTVPACIRPSQLLGEAFKTLDVFMEAQEIARRCKQALVERRVPASQMLVVARDIAKYEAAMTSAFSNAGLPFFIDESIEFQALPLMKFFRQLFALAVNDFPRRDVIDCLRSPYCERDRLGFSASQLERLDKATLNAGIVSGRKRWHDFLQTQDEEFAIKLEAFMLLVTPPATGTIADFCCWMEDREAEIRNQKKGKSPLRFDELEALQGLRTTLQKLLLQDQLFPSGPITYSQFLTRFSMLLEQSTVRRTSESDDVIYICSAEHAPNRRFEEIYIAGVIEGEFPKHSGESGFVSGEERGRWLSYGVDITNPREEQGFERALFKSLIDRSRSRVCFSYPQVNLSGDDIVPSFYFSDGTIAAQPEAVSPSQAGLRLPYAAQEAVAAWLWNRPGLELPEQWLAQTTIADFWKGISVPLVGAFQRHEKNTGTAYNGYLVDLTEDNWLEVELPKMWSATSLGTYGECPFKFWVSNTLQVKRREEPEAGLNQLVKGRLYHKALELFYKRAQALTIQQRQDQMPQLLSESLTSAVEFTANDPDFTPGPYWENEQKDMLFRLRRFVQKDDERLQPTSFQPHLFEKKFGWDDEDSAPPLALQTDHGEILVKGSIDRIDIDATSPTEKRLAAVIDYKLGSTPITEEDARKGAKIQLPLYAMAVERAIIPGAQVSSGNYLGILAAKSLGRVNFEKSTDLVDTTQAFVRQSVNNIKRGDFSVRPYSKKACKYCDHATVCRIADLKRLSPPEEL